MMEWGGSPLSRLGSLPCPPDAALGMAGARDRVRGEARTRGHTHGVGGVILEPADDAGALVRVARLGNDHWVPHHLLPFDHMSIV